jgi:hypothetical protein
MMKKLRLIGGINQREAIQGLGNVFISQLFCDRICRLIIDLLKLHEW